ncbi:TPA: hypothetical protein HIT55_003968 [Escherichia fergusonii]|nr:hypothetical protein [Escherichia fergusonii]
MDRTTWRQSLRGAGFRNLALPTPVDRIKDQLSYNLIDNIDLNSPGIVTQLDLFLRKNKNIKKMSLRNVSSICSEHKHVTSILVGLWALDFLESSPNIYNKNKIK